MLYEDLLKNLLELSIEQLVEVQSIAKELIAEKQREQLTENYKETLQEYKSEDLGLSPEAQKLDLILI